MVRKVLRNWPALLLCLLCLEQAAAQHTVDPADLVLTVTIEKTGTLPFQHEMVLLTIHGIYRRHITLEKLEPPDFGPINWMQLGEDHWYKSVIDGQTVKNMRRRMALFPDRAGELKIGPFIHHLTLLDENNNWFAYDVISNPVTLEVLPAPSERAWWFPVRKLKISDRWSNAPDQLREGEGVLRVVKLTATGASPDMIPPMPQLKSPSALIFPHPEKRLVELSPEGPVSIAFWRWTIKPQNGVSAIVEPMEVSYFDTIERSMKSVVISPQRVAISPAMPPVRNQSREQPLRAPPAMLKPVWLIVAVLAAFIGGLSVLMGTSRTFDLEPLRKRVRLSRLKFMLRQNVKAQDLCGLRRTCQKLYTIHQPNIACKALLDELDGEIYGRSSDVFGFRDFHRRFCAALRSVETV